MFAHKEVWRLFGPPLAFTDVKKPGEEWHTQGHMVQGVSWLLFTSSGDLVLYPL